MRGKLLKKIVAGVLLCAILVAHGGGTSYASKDVISGVICTKEGTISDGSAITQKFNLAHEATVTISFVDYTYGYYLLSIVDNATGENLFEQSGQIRNKELTIEEVLPAGNYTLKLQENASYGWDLDYNMTVSYCYNVSDENPFYYISNEELTVYTKKTAQLSVQVRPETAYMGEVVWSSSNPNVATVSEQGVVTGVAAGTTIVRGVLDGVTYSCKVTVKEPTYTLSTSSLALYEKGTGTIKVNTVPADYGVAGAKWTSSNSSVAAVSAQGVVTAKKKGSATITFTVGTVKKTCKVTVMPIALNITKKNMYVKDKLELKVNGAPGKVSWKSSNKKVAAVSKQGVVKAQKGGKATITAKVGGKSYKCKIVVKDQPTLSKKTLKIEVGTTSQLAIIRTAKKATWSSSNKRVATVSKNGKVKGVRTGTATITAKVGKKKFKCKVTVKKLDICKRVGKPISTNNNYALVLAGFGFEKNFVNGIKLLWEAENLSGKTINYYTVTLYFYNSVGDPAYDEITGKNYKTLKYVGPVKPGKNLLIYTNVGYVPACSKITVGDIKLEYSDGTTESGWYGYYTTKKFYD